MKRIAIDIDGVLADYNHAMWRLLQACGADMRPFEGPDPDCWFWYEKYGATAEQVKEALGRQTPEWWGHLDPHKELTLEALRGLAELCRLHEVTFVTSRPCGRDAAWYWLDWNLNYNDRLNGPGPHVLVTPRKKHDALYAMDIDALVEDNLDTVLALRGMYEYRMPVTVVVDRAYNRGGAGFDCGHRSPNTLCAINYLLRTL